MKLTKFCPRCGEETDELVGESKKLCKECYPEVHNIVEIPSTINLKVCPVCGRLKIDNDWIEEYSLRDQLSAKYASILDSDIYYEVQFWESNEKTFSKVHVEKNGMTDTFKSEIKVKETQCESCSKFTGGFYKVKLQIRGSKTKEARNLALDKAAQATNQDRKDFMSDMAEKDNGYDLFLSTEKIAGDILSTIKEEFDPEIKRSYELVGKEDGEKVYRNVISVRIQ